MHQCNITKRIWEILRAWDEKLWLNKTGYSYCRFPSRTYKSAKWCKDCPTQGSSVSSTISLVSKARSRHFIAWKFNVIISAITAAVFSLCSTFHLCDRALIHAICNRQFPLIFDLDKSRQRKQNSRKEPFKKNLANFVRLYFPHLATFFNQILGFYYFWKVLFGNVVFLVGICLQHKENCLLCDYKFLSVALVSVVSLYQT